MIDSSRRSPSRPEAFVVCKWNRSLTPSCPDFWIGSKSNAMNLSNPRSYYCLRDFITNILSQLTVGFYYFGWPVSLTWRAFRLPQLFLWWGRYAPPSPSTERMFVRFSSSSLPSYCTSFLFFCSQSLPAQGTRSSMPTTTTSVCAYNLKEAKCETPLNLLLPLSSRLISSRCLQLGSIHIRTSVVRKFPGFRWSLNVSHGHLEY